MSGRRLVPIDASCLGWQRPCGVVFLAWHPSAVLCAECRREKQRSQVKQWKLENQERVKFLQASYRKRTSATVEAFSQETEVEWDGQRFTRHDFAILLIKSST